MKDFQLKRIICGYYLYSGFKQAFFYLPILVVYFNDILNSESQVGILLAVQTLSCLFFEVPTGYIADLVSRKLSLVVGLITACISLLIILISNNFMLLVIAQVFFGISETLSSGAQSAFLYDNLKKLNMEKIYKNVVRNSTLISSIILFCAYISGGLLYKINVTLPFRFAVFSFLIALLIIITIPELYKNTMQSSERKVCDVKDKKNMWALLLFGSVPFSVLYSTYIYLIPLFLRNIGVDEKYFGILFSVAVLAIGIGGKISGMINNEESFIFCNGPIFMGIVFLISGILYTPLVIIIFMLLMRIIWGSYDVVLDIKLNDYFSTDNRSFYLSVLSALVNGMTCVLTLFFSFLINCFKKQDILVIIAIVYLLIGIYGLFLYKKNFKESYNNNG